MAATDGQVIVAATRWNEEGYYLKEYIAKTNLPSVAKIIKGQYSGLGVPTLPNPGLQSTALVISAGKRHKIIAQPIKIKEGRRIEPIGPKIFIPETYKGYFELLSEDGRAIRCMESVSEIAKRKLEFGYLIRDPLRAICAKVDLNGSTITDGAKNLPVGEIIQPRGETQVIGSKSKYLKCIDSKGDVILLNIEQRGKFSAIAKEDNISGVHTAKTLLNKRLPVTVRLVHGTPPVGLKSASHFVPELRLLSLIEEEHVFALPLQKETNTLIAIPLAAPLKLQKCKNEEQIKNFMEFSRLVEKCNRLLVDASDRIHLLDGKLGDKKRLSVQINTPLIKTGYFLRKSASCDTANLNLKCNINKDENKTSDEYDEIDQIYDYVRGFAPLPKNLKNTYVSNDIKDSKTICVNDKPEPPPIETIPTKKLQIKAEKRTRRTAGATFKETKPSNDKLTALPKLYTKNSNKTKVIIKQKVATKEISSPIASPIKITKEESPIFNIRYKSLTNIQMELDGTLNSSNSGGRTSGDSAAGPKLPEKRSRKISRPKSLSNLVWELGGCVPDVSSNEKQKSKCKNDNRLKCGQRFSLGNQKRTLYL